MKRVWLLLFVTLAYILSVASSNRIKEEDYTGSIHMIYMPWDRQGRLKRYHHSFDKHFYIRVKKEVPQAKVYMWTYKKLRKFSEEKEPGLWDKLWGLAQHPVQIVDFYRWFVVYHLGGLYWQYESVRSVPWDAFEMGGVKGAVLYTETVLSDKIAKEVGQKYVIRKGKPEENTRVCTQIFWAKPYNHFVKYVMDHIIARMEKYIIKEDYDVLYIGGNAMLSEVYDQYTQKEEVLLVDSRQRLRMVWLASHASWRQQTTLVNCLTRSGWKNVLRPVYIAVSALFRSHGHHHGKPKGAEPCGKRGVHRPDPEGEGVQRGVF